MFLLCDDRSPACGTQGCYHFIPPPAFHGLVCSTQNDPNSGFCCKMRVGKLCAPQSIIEDRGDHDSDLPCVLTGLVPVVTGTERGTHRRWCPGAGHSGTHSGHLLLPSRRVLVPRSSPVNPSNTAMGCPVASGLCRATSQDGDGQVLLWPRT